HRLRRRAAARRPRLRQGAPRRTLVPRPAGRRNARRRAARLMINLETPRKFNQLISQAHQVAAEILRPNSRKYDTLEHEYPKELDMRPPAIDGLTGGGGRSGAGPGAVGSNGSPSPAKKRKTDDGENRNGS